MKMENVFYSLLPPTLITVTLFALHKVSKLLKNLFTTNNNDSANHYGVLILCDSTPSLLLVWPSES